MFDANFGEAIVGGLMILGGIVFAAGLFVGALVIGAWWAFS